VWVQQGTPPRIVALLHDGQRVLSTLRLPGGLTLRAGDPVRFADDVAVVGDASIALTGPEAGVVTAAASGSELDPWIRYFYATSSGSPPALAGLRFRLLEAPAAARLRVDPARPLDRSRSAATPGSTASTSTFRTPRGAKVMLAAQPPHSRYVLALDPERDEYYWTLDGVWRWGVSGSSAGRVEIIPGISGAEYVGAPAGFLLSFVAGAPAFARAFSPQGPHGRTAVDADLGLVATIPGVADLVTTAWLYVLPPDEHMAGAAGYFSQPDIAGLFRPSRDDAFLHALELQAAALPANATTPYAPRASFPAAPFAGLADAPPTAIMRRFETEVLGAARSRVIYGLKPTGQPPGPRGLVSGSLAGAAAEQPVAIGVARGPGAPVGVTAPTGPSAPTGPTGPVTDAVTPQGLLSTLSADLTRWEQIVLAQAPEGSGRLTLTGVQDRLREAMLSNQLFLVVSDVERLREHCSTTYSITDGVLARARRHHISEPVIAAAARLRGRVYATRAYFSAALDQVLWNATQPDKDFFLRYSELAQLTIAGWTFDLAAWRWNDASAPTIMIVKFADRDVESLIEDLTAWTLPASFNADDGTLAQQRLLAIVRDARARVATESELAYFVDTVLASEQAGVRDVWNGVLFLNPVVPSLPPDLGALVAGLTKDDVRAHHLGVTLTSFDSFGDRIELAGSSLFGLLLYTDDEDLVYSGSAYDFKVVSLRVRFANSTIASFSSQVELLVGQLFNELSSLRDSLRGDNVLLDGTLEHGAYRFTSSTLRHFTIASRVLDFVTIARAQLVTVDAQSTADKAVARFIFDGRLGFRSLAAADLFGYGPADPGDESGLAYTNLMISMQFDPADAAATRTLEFVAGQTTFDLAHSAARPGSLPRRFPLVPAALRQSETKRDGSGDERPPTPADLGFITVQAPLPTGALGEVWFGLELTMSFGSPGALAPQLAFTGAMLLAWAPSADSPNVAVGLRLPGSSGASRALTIMGPLKLDIGSLDLLRESSSNEYMMRFANVALTFLGLRFPSGGRTNALLFGNPDPAAGGGALGWYAAYRKDLPKPKQQPALSAGSEPEPSDEEGCTACRPR
jgi:hypothetical protein